jgi:hypothetical protein
MGSRRYALAPMSASFVALTLVLMGLPFAMAWQASRIPAPMSSLLYGVSALVVFLFTVILFWSRPRAFEVTDEALEIQWPLRLVKIPLREIARVELVTFDGVRAEFGSGMRVGVGGVYGAFGSYVTHAARIRMYITRYDELVLVRVRSGDPWLIAPAHAGAFVQALKHTARLT